MIITHSQTPVYLLCHLGVFPCKSACKHYITHAPCFSALGCGGEVHACGAETAPSVATAKDGHELAYEWKFMRNFSCSVVCKVKFVVGQLAQTCRELSRCLLRFLPACEFVSRQTVSTWSRCFRASKQHVGGHLEKHPGEVPSNFGVSVANHSPESIFLRASFFGGGHNSNSTKSIIASNWKISHLPTIT